MGELLAELGNWGLPISVIGSIGIIFIITQIIGEVMELCGKAAPTILKIRKYFKARKEYKRERELQYIENTKTLKEIKDQQARVEVLLLEAAKQNQKNQEIIADFNTHYCPEKIAQRDRWMLEVNSTMHWARERAIIYDASVNELKELTNVVKQQHDIVEKQRQAIDLNNKMTSELYKQSTRTQILDFSHKLVNARKADKPVIFSREEFKKIRKSYEAYERFLQMYGGTNGEVDDAMEIIKEAEAGKLPNIEFLEDLRD